MLGRGINLQGRGLLAVRAGLPNGARSSGCSQAQRLGEMSRVLPVASAGGEDVLYPIGPLVRLNIYIDAAELSRIYQNFAQERSIFRRHPPVPGRVSRQICQRTNRHASEPAFLEQADALELDGEGFVTGLKHVQDRTLLRLGWLGFPLSLRSDISLQLVEPEHPPGVQGERRRNRGLLLPVFQLHLRNRAAAGRSEQPKVMI